MKRPSRPNASRLILAGLYCTVGLVPLEAAPIDLQALVDGAAAGDTLRLEAGLYTAAVIDKPLVLWGRGSETVLDGGGTGHVLALRSPQIAVHNLRLVGSGRDIDLKESGVWIDRLAPGARLEALHIEECGFGIWVDAAVEPWITGCRIVGRDDASMVSDLGNGIHLFNVKGGTIKDNYITKGRDGIYISNSTGCLIANNHIHRTRFAIHYMYSHANQVVGNRIDSSSVGIALMYSKKLFVADNRVRACHTHGILLRNLYYSRIVNNEATANKDGLFFSGCSYDTLSGNYIARNERGIQVSDSPENLVTGNAFIDNTEPLNYQDITVLVWDSEKGGNYWSEYVGWDRDGDGIGDRRYYPMDIAAHLVQRFPAIRPVLHSPAMTLLQALEAQFPVLRPPGVLEPRPLMANPIPATIGRP